MSDVLLSIKNLRVQFGDLLAVDDVSLELRAGDLLGLIGPNGAGKTTTLRAASGLQSVTTGSIRILGNDVFRCPTIVGRHLAFTPDTPAVYESLTVAQFLEFIARCYGLPHGLTAERIDHWLDQLWLSEKKQSKISTLSRGMRQRVAVARSLLPDPHVVLMDEPAAGIDPAGRVQLRQLLASLRDQGKALIVSSHILADLAEYCTHIAIMGHGRLHRYGTVAQIGGVERLDHTRYRMVLAERVGDLAARLSGVAGLEGNGTIAMDGLTVTFEYDNERAAAARLLRDLIGAGLPVAEFRPLEADLEEAYLRTGIRQVD